MTPTVPLPPPHDVWTTCAEAFAAWGEGRVRWDSLIDGAIVLADGARCPIADSPHRAPVEVHIPAGQPPYVPPPELAQTGSWVWTAIGVGCALLVVGIVALIVSERRGRRGSVGAHSWPGEDDIDPDGDDEALLAAVTGLGDQREPDEQARAAAAAMPDDWPDLRGERDKDPQAPNPWRSQ